jgi:hypothetical protein
MKTIQEIQVVHEKYFKLLTKYFGESQSGKIEEFLGERLATAPRALTPDEGGYPGGLIDFSLKVAKQSKIFADKPELQSSIVRVALVHELGKIGDDSNDQFLNQDSSWHREKLNQHFKYNEACEKMSFTHRTLYFIAKFGLELSTDEWIAIITSGGFHLEENRFYARDNHLLSHTFQVCKCLAENELKVSALSSH